MAEEIEVVEPVETEVVENVVVTQPVETPAPESTMVPLSALEAERKKRQEESKKRQEERELTAYWKGKAESMAQVHTPQPPPEAPKTPQAPVKPARLNSEQFDTWAEYEAAQAKQDDDYLAKREEYILEKARWTLKQENEQQKQEQTQRQKIETHVERLKKAAELDPEIEDIANNWNVPGKYQMPLSAAMQDAILESDLGPEVLRHLYNNKQEAIRIAKLSPTSVGRAMEKIEAELNKKTAVKTVSTAPPPIQTVKATGVVDVDDDLRPAADVIREMRERSFKRR
jgi:hypothetical protein